MDEQVQTCPLRARKEVEARIIREGAERWKQQLEENRIKKLEDQEKVRDLLEKWPWGREQIKPRRLRNLRLEGLFPHQDYQKATRLVGTLDFSRPGGGAPNVNEHGYRMPRTREDPMLRFQWANDMRRTVDNNIRYRTNKVQQMQYKKDLDTLVAEKKKHDVLQKKQDKLMEHENFMWPSPWGKPGPGSFTWRHPGHIGFNFLKSLGWSNSETLKKLANEKCIQEQKAKKTFDTFVNSTIRSPNSIERKERVIFPSNGLVKGPITATGKYHTGASNNSVVTSNGILRKRHGQLSPLQHDGKGDGIELVPLLLQKQAALKIPLCSTDVTRYQNNSIHSSKWKLEGDKYLMDLGKQMTLKLQQLKNNRDMEIANSQKHFSTWDGFWGRPGHGAPRSEFRKGCLNTLLYPKFQTPVAVA